MLSAIEKLILQLVDDIAPDVAYGIAISRHLNASGTRCGKQTAYNALLRLRDLKLLTSFKTEPTGKRGGRARTCFAITLDGKKALGRTS